MAALGSYERDVELYAIAAKAHRHFRDEYPHMEHLEARALICAVEAFRRPAVADALLEAAGDLLANGGHDDTCSYGPPGSCECCLGEHHRWLIERANKIAGGSDA